MKATLPKVVRKTLRKFVNNGVYLFPDGRAYIALRPLARVSWFWRFFTLDVWLTGMGVMDAVYVRDTCGAWHKRLRANKRYALRVSKALDLDNEVKFSGTVLAKKRKGTRLPVADRDWYWKMRSEQRGK